MGLIVASLIFIGWAWQSPNCTIYQMVQNDWKFSELKSVNPYPIIIIINSGGARTLDLTIYCIIIRVFLFAPLDLTRTLRTIHSRSFSINFICHSCNIFTPNPKLNQTTLKSLIQSTIFNEQVLIVINNNQFKSLIQR
jgi:hypothetical protein